MPEITTAPFETVIDPLNDYVILVDDSETPDAINKLLLRYLRQVEIGIAVSDETTDLTTGTAKVTFRSPFAFTLTAIRASVTTAPTGSTIIVDVNLSGATIMTTNKLSIDAGEKTSTTAAVAAGITTSAITDDGELVVDIDQVGSTIAGTGLKLFLIGYRS